ncbi:Zinc finger TRAF-type [Trinorchestia longiramus]|nr:Zinc finger TRAF-type [Trinorchestia longiramus]
MEEDSEAPTYVSRLGGYDYEFIEHLDPKYECGICLLALRHPHQTVCGHRFCWDCISNCLSSRGVCPIDNRELGPGDVFPDACIEREVLELLVRCPGYTHGCKRHVSLRNLQPHILACSYQVVLCPNQCASTVLCGELQQHLMETCALRPTTCSLCKAVYTLDKEQVHRSVCGDVAVRCDGCSSEVRRADLAHHLSTHCPDTVVPCLYVEYGCTRKCKRSLLDRHLDSDVQLHLQLVSSAYKKMNTFVSELSRTVGLIQSPSFSRQPSLRSQVSTSSPIQEENEAVLQGGVHDLNSKMEAAEEGLSASECAETEGAQALPDEYKMKSKIDSKKREAISAEAQRHQLHLSNLNSGFSFPNKTSSNEKILRAVSDKTVDLDQRMLEETIRLDNLTKQMDGIELVINDRLVALSGRFCNGDFIWRVHNFSTRCNDIRNQNLSTYSPPFYTSQFGYKCCIRLGVKCKDEQDYLSLYILFMKGEYDDVLEWPFKGHISLGLLDCSSNGNKKHIVDSVDSSPSLQAFQRPLGFRNEKSFGFTQFCLMDDLHAGDGALYVVNDTVTVRAKVQSYGTFGCDGISPEHQIVSAPRRVSDCKN